MTRNIWKKCIGVAAALTAAAAFTSAPALARHGADDGAGHAQHGADDGAGHRHRGGDDAAKASSSLQPGASASGASGECRVKFGAGRSRFEVRVGGLAPNAEHTLSVDDTTWATFTTDKKGRGRVRFSSHPKGRDLALPGDPRGGMLSVGDGANEVLSGVCSGEGESEGATAKIRARLAPTDLAPAGSESSASFEIRKDGRTRFEVEIEGVPAGDYAVFVDGAQRGTITVGALGRGGIEFGDDNGGPALDFDPRGKQIDVSDASGVLFTGTLAGSIPGVTQCTPSEDETPLVAAPAAAGGSGHTKLRVRDDCRRDFSVEIEDVPAGAYDLFVGGVLRGTIPVADVAGNLKGEIEFTSKAGEEELPLDFDPVGATVEVKQGDVLFFSLTQGAPGSGGGTGGGSSCTGAPVEIDLPLLAVGGSGAKGDVRFRLRDDCRADFTVEIEDVADGDYDVHVGGVSRGTLSVSAGAGELEFRDPVEAGKLPLDFDPRGQDVEVFDGATLILQRALPN